MSEQVKEIKPDEKTKKDLEDIGTLEKVKKVLEEDIKKLQIARNGQEAIAHSADLQDEEAEKHRHQARMTTYAAEEKRIELKRVAVEKRIDQVEILEQSINQRKIGMDRREARAFDLEERYGKLNLERSNFEEYKRKIGEELKEAKEIINSADVAWKEVNIERDRLKGVAIATEAKEKEWNDTIGKLQTEIKSFEIEKENFMGLKQHDKTHDESKDVIAEQGKRIKELEVICDNWEKLLEEEKKDERN